MMASEYLVRHTCRAKYYRTADGSLKLAQIQQMGLPAFIPEGWEKVEPDLLFKKAEEIFSEEETVQDREEPKAGDPDLSNLYRALRRAKIRAFDKICCNPDLDTFATFTLSPEAVADRASYDECYNVLRRWLCDRVNRRGLKYIIAPERHKAGGIHFHAIMNSEALRLSPAMSAKTGRPLTHEGAPLYNVTDWRHGYTSAELIQSATLDREKVAKYIFKYMGKQGIEGKIGGRYLLTGGRLVEPVYLYGNDPEEFLSGECAYVRTAEHEGITYKEWSFI